MNGRSEDKKCKRVKKKVVKRGLTFDEYDVSKVVNMNRITSRKHRIFTETATKNALSANNDKRLIMVDRINSLAIGHWKTLEKLGVLLSDEVNWNFKAGTSKKRVYERFC